MQHEIIVVDDNSSCDLDELEVICKENRVLLLRNSKNLYLSLSRQQGMKHAAGSHILFHDDDDEMYPSALDAAWSIVQENPSVPHTFKIDDRIGNEIIEAVDYTIDGVTQKASDFIGNQMAVHSTIVPKSELNEHCFSATIRYHEDLLMWTQVWQSLGKWSFRNFSIGVYDKDYSQMTAFSCDSSREKFRGLQEILNTAKSSEISDHLERKMRGVISILVSRKCFLSLRQIPIFSAASLLLKDIQTNNFEKRLGLVIKMLAFKFILLLKK